MTPQEGMLKETFRGKTAIARFLLGLKEKGKVVSNRRSKDRKRNYKYVMLSRKEQKIRECVQAR